MGLKKSIKQTGAYFRPVYESLVDSLNLSKGERTLAVTSIIVTVVRTDNTILRFNGDEISQNRMHSALTVMERKGLTEVQWILADNTSALVTPTDLIEALYLAGNEQTLAWL